MAPSTPVSLLIVDNVKTTLQSIVAGTEYFHTFREVVVNQGGPWDQKLFPSITLVPLTERQGGDLINSEVLSRDFVAIAAFENPVDAVTTLTRAVHDIHKALMADRQRGGIAINTEWQAATPSIDADEEAVLAWVECQFQVQFRTSNTDMTEVR